MNSSLVYMVCFNIRIAGPDITILTKFSHCDSEEIQDRRMHSIHVFVIYYSTITRLTQIGKIISVIYRLQ